MKPNKEKRFLDFQNILSALRLDNLPIVVEGKRDTIALRKLEITNPIIELNDGTSVLATIERLFQDSGPSTEFIIMTDWDKTGNKLAKQLILYGEASDLKPNDDLRRKLSRFTDKEISCVEELSTFAHSLGNETLSL
tara:strand:+ start:84 stop:494 length:411 start_codon:yes stop_codon:yes gene_type:complete